jgi:hypothetical protein
MERVTRGKGDPFMLLVLLLANLLTSALASERRLYPFLFAGFQVKGVALDLLDNVFLLYLALEAAQRVLEGFTLLQPNFRQTDTPPNPSGKDELVITQYGAGSQEKKSRRSGRIWRG